MATMITELYKALKEAGASEESATAAAEALAGDRPVIKELKDDIATIKTGVADLSVRMARLEATVQLLARLQFVLLGAVALILIRVFWPATGAG